MCNIVNMLLERTALRAVGATCVTDDALTISNPEELPQSLPSKI